MLNLSLTKEREILTITTRKGRRKTDKMLVEGVRAIETAITQGITPDYLVVSEHLLTPNGKNFLEAYPRSIDWRIESQNS